MKEFYGLAEGNPAGRLAAREVVSISEAERL